MSANESDPDAKPAATPPKGPDADGPSASKSSHSDAISATTHASSGRDNVSNHTASAMQNDTQVGPEDERSHRNRGRDSGRSRQQARSTPGREAAQGSDNSGADSANNQKRGRRGGRRSRDLPPPTGPEVSPALLEKLRSTLRDGTYIVFDIETTGGNPERNGITEIFAIRWHRGEILDTFYSLVNPGIPIPPIVRRMTGISNQTVRHAPRIEEVMPKIVEFVGDDVLVSHNTIGDMRFLRHFAQQVCHVELGNFYLCTHLLVEKLAPESPDKSLKGLAEHFDLPRGELHRAEADAYVTLELFKVLLQKLAARSAHRIEEAVRLQGDMESGMRLGWGVAPDALVDVPNGPGVFFLFDHEKRVLFLSSALQLDREVAKLGAFPQLPRQLLRLVLRSYDLKTESAPNAFAAMLAESDALAGAGPSVNFHPSQWHQRFVQALLIIEEEDGLRIEVGPLEQGVKYAFGPVRDRRLLLEMVDKLGAVLGGQRVRQSMRFPKDREALIISLFEGQLDAQRQHLQQSSRSWRLWFRRAQRKLVTESLAFVDKLTELSPPARLENLFSKSGVLAVQNPGGGWHLHQVVAGHPTEVLEVPADVDPRRVIKEQGPSFADHIRTAMASHVKPAPLPLREALRVNATLWWILYGRHESRFIPLAELSGESLQARPQP